jgi:integrase
MKPLHTTENDYVSLNQEGNPLTPHGARVFGIESCEVEIRRRKPYCTRHTFTSVGLSNAVNINWLGKYCGTSVATIERHYGKYIKSDAAEQLERLAGTVTPNRDPRQHQACCRRSKD